MNPPPKPLPPLREEISLLPGPINTDGSPTWTLHDPVDNRFFRVGWFEFEILSRWDLATPEAIAAAIASETTLPHHSLKVSHFIDQLAKSNLLSPQSDADRDRFLAVQRSQQTHWARWLLKNYLFMRLPLWRPDDFLRRTLPALRWVFTTQFNIFVVLIAMVGVILLLRQWETFTSTFLHFFTLSGMVYYGAALFLSKAVHELSHAYTARYFGCRVPNMGVAFLVMWPVLYTDTSEAWKLVSRRQRLAVGMAGIQAEMVLAACATLAWSFLPDGPLRSAAFLLASSVWIVTLVVNLNPLSRFDGYFVLADAMDLANMQNRAFVLARWWLREQLFGFGNPPPETFTTGRRRFLIAYAVAIWIYRFVLFLGIAILVYHFFFKILGIFLFAVEVGWFLLRPIIGEIMQWFKHRHAVRFNRHSLIALLLLGSFLAGVMLPWRFTLARAPATMQASQYTTIYAPVAGRLVALHVQSGQKVEKDDLLFHLEDPDIQYHLDTNARKIVLLRWRLSVQSLEFDPLDRDQVLTQQLTSAQSEHQTLAAEENKQRVRAPFAGVIVDMADPMNIGDWITADEPLMTLVDNRRPIINSYVAEEDLDRVKEGAATLFYEQDGYGEPLSGPLSRLDQTITRYLPQPYLASIYGGTIPVRREAADKLIVEGSVYRADMIPEQTLKVQQITAGVLLIQAAPESLFSRFWRQIRAVLIRESGF